MNYYERHIGDYLRDTAHLSLLEHGVYGRLLDVYYTREGGIPADQVERLIGARSKDERAALAGVLSEFFDLADGMLYHDRCDREIARYIKKAERNREVGKLGGRPKKAQTQTEPTKNPDGFQTEPTKNPLQSPVTSNQTEAIASAAAKPPRASRKCPASFDPVEPDAWIAEHCPGIDWRAQTAIFRDHTFKNPMTDWPGAWRNWMRRSVATPIPRVSPVSFRQSDEQAAAERIFEMTGGLLGKPPVGRSGEVIEMEQPNAIRAIR